MELIFYLAPLFGGVGIALLPGVNNFIAQYTGRAGFAILLNFLLGAVVLTSIYLLFSTVNLANLKEIPLWSFLGGLYGTVTVVVMTITPSKLGIGKTLAVFITARLTSATVIDHFGWFQMLQELISFLQVVGIALAVIGTLFILRVRAKQSIPQKTILIYCLLCFLSGIFSSLQSTTNASLLQQTNDMVFVTWLNFIENLLCFLIFYKIFSHQKIHIFHPQKVYIWGLLSVLCSLTVISMMALGSSTIGVANTVVLSIITQMITSIIIDHFGWLRVAQHSFNSKSLIGLLLLLSGAYSVISY